MKKKCNLYFLLNKLSNKSIFLLKLLTNNFNWYRFWKKLFSKLNLISPMIKKVLLRARVKKENVHIA